MPPPAKLASSPSAVCSATAAAARSLALGGAEAVANAVLRRSLFTAFSAASTSAAVGPVARKEMQ
jgi:hypothetical protein